MFLVSECANFYIWPNILLYASFVCDSLALLQIVVHCTFHTNIIVIVLVIAIYMYMYICRMWVQMHSMPPLMHILECCDYHCPRKLF